MLFALKKAVSPFLFPLPFSFLLIAVSGLLWKLGRRAAAKTLLGVALVVIYVSSTPIVSGLLLLNLETVYLKYAGQKVEYVAVLGGHHKNGDKVPVSSILGNTSLARLTEGVLVYRQNEGAKLILSGYRGGRDISNAEAMKKVALAMGVPEGDIILEPRPKDTDDEARLISQIVKDKPFALVTSASHMPRSMYLFSRQGARAIAAPTSYITSGRFSYTWKSFIPSGSAASDTQVAWHEYLGLVLAYLRY